MLGQIEKLLQRSPLFLPCMVAPLPNYSPNSSQSFHWLLTWKWIFLGTKVLLWPRRAPQLAACKPNLQQLRCVWACPGQCLKWLYGEGTSYVLRLLVTPCAYLIQTCTHTPSQVNLPTWSLNSGKLGKKFTSTWTPTPPDVTLFGK